MKAHPVAEVSCPLAAIDRRLADAHRLWHQAEAAYFDPDGFRLAVQNAIQNLRSVTFILQSHKAAIPNFHQWYGDYVDEKHSKRGKWQERLHTDSLMRWMVEARNRIEKRGDLESHSFVRAEIIASYLDEGPLTEVPAHLFDNVKALLRSIPNTALGQHIRRNGMLRMQRRWVENTLPDYELLDAVAIAYGKIAELVHDAHSQIGLDPPQMIHDDDGEKYDLPAMGWRFPCMIGHELRRTLMISLADGSKVEFETKSVPVSVNPAEIAALQDRYGVNPLEAMAGDYKTNADLAAAYFAQARRMFLRDGYHISVMFLVRDRKPIRMIQVNVENVQQKYAVMRQLADDVTTIGADTAMMIGEIWRAQADQLRPYERPADSPVRTEALVLYLVSKSGEPLDLLAEIVRAGEKVSLGDTESSEGMAAFQFAPFYQAWGRPVPQSWMDASRVIMAAAKPQ